ncbi:hypothetical protein ABT59_02990 [Enterococcus cecorum]|nr:hypothetical protein ABT59_02990 [Enterococcus cecorum]KLN94802.1 hypothetical protein ABT60_03160 [Enterococcus cecorum]KLO73842.1 hypothetical protein AA989_05725 [Enterococcus cecorum]
MPLSSFFWIFLKKKSKKMIDNDFNHVYTENVNKRPVPQNKSSALILFFLIYVGTVPQRKEENNGKS